MNVRSCAPLVKLAASLAAAVLIIGYLYVVLADVHSGGRMYKAMFTDVSLLTTGSPVRVAGVEVGKVTGVDSRSGAKGHCPAAAANCVEVAFTVDDSVDVTTTTTATVRFKDLIGNRYLELAPGSGSQLLPAGHVLSEAGVAALDLDTLFNGFKPLFQGLDPAHINKLAGEIVATVQGQGGAIYSLLGNVASLTQTLANRDALIGQVITNLNSVLGTVNARQSGLSALIDQLQELVTGLKSQAKPILDAVVDINSFTASAASLLADANPGLGADLPALEAVSRTLNKNSSTITNYLSELPSAYTTLKRAGSYGNFFNIYVCAIRLKIGGTDSKPLLTPYVVNSQVPRCSS